MKTLQQMEVEWYQLNGKYPERIKTGSIGPYVVGDKDWNRLNFKRAEFIEHAMCLSVREALTK